MSVNQLDSRFIVILGHRDKKLCRVYERIEKRYDSLNHAIGHINSAFTICHDDYDYGVAIAVDSKNAEFHWFINGQSEFGPCMLSADSQNVVPLIDAVSDLLVIEEYEGRLSKSLLITMLRSLAKYAMSLNHCFI